MKIIWISAFFHDSAAAFIEDWKIISAVQEERFTRKKQDEWFPVKSIEWILEENNLSIEDIDYFVFYEKPFLKFERLLENYLSEVPFWIWSFFTAIPVWIKEKLFLKKILVQELEKIETGLNEKKWIFKNENEKKETGLVIKNKTKFSTHHWSHAWSAFYPSPFEDAAILTIDWVWEWTTTSIAHWKSEKIEFLQDIKYPHSLWLFYSAITYFLWFKVNSWEYKVMWLAPYWEESWIQKYYKLMKENLIDIKDDWSFRLNLKYFSYLRWLKMTNKKMEKVFWIKRRIPEKDLEQVHMDIAWALQILTEEIMIKLAKTAKKITWSKNLCLAWWVALNCVWNWKILEEKIFENIWIQPASWDAWGAVWCALDFYYSSNPRPVSSETGLKDGMNWSYLWPKSSEKEILEMCENFWAKYEKFSDEEISEKISEKLKDWNVIWWHQWKMEYWPRSLWARSIIWNSQNPKMQEKMNLKIKFRESFRPFAPVVLEEDVSKYFEIDVKSPYMLLVANVQKNIRKKISDSEKKLFWIEKLNVPKSEIPAVTHVDYSARVQTVSKVTNPKFHNLISKFKEKTWCSVLINTSFNVRWEPIVCTAEDSYKCFMRTWMDYLVIENFVFKKEDQPDFEDKEKWEEKFVLD